MSYEKQTWANGDVITATGLNHMEDGIAGAGGGVLLVNVEKNGNTQTLDKTWDEIHTAYMAGSNIVLDFDTSLDDPATGYTAHSYCLVCSVYYSIPVDPTIADPYYSVVSVDNNKWDEFATGSPDGYPSDESD